MLGLGAFDRGARGSFLVFIVWEDGAAILGADVVALAVERRRIMRCEEDIEQHVVTDDVGIVRDADRLGMAGIAAAHIAIAGIVGGAADIAADNRFDAVDLQEYSLGAPETSAGQRRGFGRHIALSIFTCLADRARSSGDKGGFSSQALVHFKGCRASRGGCAAGSAALACSIAAISSSSIAIRVDSRPCVALAISGLPCSFCHLVHRRMAARGS